MKEQARGEGAPRASRSAAGVWARGTLGWPREQPRGWLGAHRAGMMLGKGWTSAGRAGMLLGELD